MPARILCMGTASEILVLSFNGDDPGPSTHALYTHFNDRLGGELRQIDERAGFQPVTFSL